MLHCWCKSFLKSDVISLSYNKVHRGLLFFPDTVYLGANPSQSGVMTASFDCCYSVANSEYRNDVVRAEYVGAI